MRETLFFLGASLHALTAMTHPLMTVPAHTSSSSQLRVAEPSAYNWMGTYISDFSIHSSCNATERHEITEGLRQAIEMAQHAKNHILVHGNTSSIYRKYFGDGPTAAPIGWFDKIASGNRAGVLFRCDDPDRNCETQDNWAGHWRGSNASSETVIWPAVVPANYWGPDLMHRLYHVPLVGEGMVEHYADGYAGVQELAAGTNFTWAGSNSATLTYFATEVYAYDIAVPGEGCVGHTSAEEDDGHSQASASVSSSATSTSAAEAMASSINPTRIIPASTSATATAAPAVESSPGSECHTHDNGVVHCV